MSTLPTIAQCAAVHAAHVNPLIASGVSMLTTFITSMVTLVIGFGAGWYAKSRGVTGMQADVNTVKADVATLGTKVASINAPTQVA